MPTSPASGLFRPLHDHRLQAAEIVRHEMEMPFDITTDILEAEFRQRGGPFDVPGTRSNLQLGSPFGK